MITERVVIGGEGRPLVGELVRPAAGAPVAGVVVCHPHPAFGGTRESHVVRALVRAITERGMAALSFDFRGAGQSGGESTADHHEWDDATRALDALEDALPPATPLAIAGYSFGAWVAVHVAARDPRVRAVAVVAPGSTMPEDMGARPIAVAHPEHDHLTPPGTVADWLDSIGGGDLMVLNGADHFLRDDADRAADHLAEFLRRGLSPGGPVEGGP